MSDQHPDPSLPPEPSSQREPRPEIVGDVVFGGMDSPVAVCTLGTRSLLSDLAGAPEIAVAGRVYTENVGIERMVQNLASFASVRFLIVCGRETRHRVGQTILALHRDGLDEAGRVRGSEAPEPVMPNLTAEQLQAFRERIAVVDMIGVLDVAAIIERVRALAALPGPSPESGASRAALTAPLSGDDKAAASTDGGAASSAIQVEHVRATRDRASAWTYDPAGYFLVFVDRARQELRVEQYTQEHLLIRVIEGTGAEVLCHTIVRLGGVTLLAHAAYLGRELAKAETALAHGLEYDQDRPLSGRAVPIDDAPGNDVGR